MYSSIAESNSDHKEATRDEVLAESDNDVNDDSEEESAELERSNDNPYDLDRSGISLIERTLGSAHKYLQSGADPGGPWDHALPNIDISYSK